METAGIADAFRRRSISATASSRLRLRAHSRKAALIVRLRSPFRDALQQVPDVVLDDHVDAMSHGEPLLQCVTHHTRRIPPRTWHGTIA